MNKKVELTLEARVERLERAQRINNRIMKNQWDLRQEIGKLESRVEKLENDVFKKLDEIVVKFESLACYRKH